MLSILKELVMDARILEHDDGCPCSYMCDHTFIGDGICSACDCGVSDIKKLAVRAVQVINEASQSS
jgi:hypothetical protein